MLIYLQKGKIYNRFENSGTKKFGVLCIHQINEFSHTFQVVYWKCSENVPKKFWWSYLIPFLRFLIFFKKIHFLLFEHRPAVGRLVAKWKSVLEVAIYHSKKIFLVKAFHFIIVYPFQNTTSWSYMIIFLN